MKKSQETKYESIYQEKWKVFSDLKRNKDNGRLEKFRMIYKAQLTEMSENDSKKDLSIFLSFFAFLIACSSFALANVQTKQQVGPKFSSFIIILFIALLVLFFVFYFRYKKYRSELYLDDYLSLYAIERLQNMSQKEFENQDEICKLVKENMEHNRSEK